ncbi:hypothetical protein NDU88_005478 [Pleurodeles waltl]|uniref:Uncharacterized protein n=1 Tax=Pleurodeles waltl TaxID=8319 RepID=A0AAV7UJD9_PLEWA|nr:hypothetical protein NDU88_005478 [Pleurodeles waltl]
MEEGRRGDCCWPRGSSGGLFSGRIEPRTPPSPLPGVYRGGWYLTPWAPTGRMPEDFLGPSGPRLPAVRAVAGIEPGRPKRVESTLEERSFPAPRTKRRPIEV